MPIVVEEAVVGVQGLDVNAIGECGRDRPPGVLAVRTDQDGVVFAQAAILADPLGVDHDVPEDDGDALAGGADVFAVAGEILHQRVQLPQIADDVAADAEFGEDGYLRPPVSGSADELHHPGRVQVGKTRPDLHLHQGDGGEPGFRHGGLPVGEMGRGVRTRSPKQLCPGSPSSRADGGCRGLDGQS